MIERKITLISPKSSEDFDFLLYPSLGILYVFEAFKNCGWEVSLINGQVQESSEYEKNILSIKGGFVGIGATIVQIKETRRIAKIIKEKNPEIVIILGGPGISGLLLEEEKIFNLIVEGEAEELPKIIEEMTFSKRETLRIRCPIIKNLDSLPQISRDVLPLEAYLNLWDKVTGKKMISVVTSRGCPYDCVFCNKNISGKNFRTRSPENIVNEIEILLSRYNFDEVVICDDFFSCNKGRVLNICKEIKKRNLDFSWSAQTRVDSIDLEMIESMKDAGCTQLCFGVESGSNNILSWLRKGFNREEIEEAFKRCNDAGIKTGMCLIVGIPGEKKEDIEATKDLVKKCRPYELGISYLVPFPGTVAFERTKEWINRNDYENWNRKTLVYDFPYEVEPEVAREDIFSVFFDLIEEGMPHSPFQFTLDY
jgi:anaerobic magnesium-protoporphyrin IX monomethyl ester cyclase